MATTTAAVPLILTLNSVLTTSERATGRFIKHRLNIDRVRARGARSPAAVHRTPAGGGGRRRRRGLVILLFIIIFIAIIIII